MTELSNVSCRLGSALEVLAVLVQRADNNEDAAYDRLQLRKLMVDIVAAKRLVSGIEYGQRIQERRLFVDGAPVVERTEQGARVTFDRAVRLSPSPWPPEQVAA